MKKTFNKMPDELKSLFIKRPNPSKDEVLAVFPNTEPSKSGHRGLQGSPFMGIDGSLPKQGTNTIRSLF